MTIHHKDLDKQGIFYIKGDKGVTSELNYTKDGKGVITITHMETKIPEEGKGLASKLLSHIVDFARRNNLKINPLCPFAEVQFDEKISYQDVRV